MVTCIVSLIPSIAVSQTNRYVDASGTDSGDCSDANSPCATINYAVGQSSTNDIINLSEGTFSAADISTRVTLSGRGDATIIQTLDLSAAVNGTDELVIENVRVSGGSSPGIDIQTSYVSLHHISADGYNNNVRIEQASSITNIAINNCQLDNATGASFIVNMQSVGAAVSQLDVSNTTFNDSRFGFYSQMGNATNAGNYLQNVNFRNCTFNNNSQKGIYIENITNATFENISVVNSGTDNSYAFNNGIDINLKWQAYSDISILNSRILDCGAIGPNDIDTAPENRRSTALAIKARTDGSYASSAASLSNLTLDGVVIDGLVGDLRLGEMGQTNTGISVASVDILHCSFANDGIYCFANEQTGTLNLEHNYWGGSSPRIDDFSGATTSQSNELADEIVDNTNSSYATLADALLGGGSIIKNLPAGTISGTATITSAVTLTSPGAGYLDADSRTTLENLTLSTGSLTMGSDIAVSSTLSLSSDLDLNGQNLILEGNMSGSSSILANSGQLILEGAGDISSLLTSGSFNSVVTNRSGATIALGADLNTEYLELQNGFIDASSFDLVFNGLTALGGNDGSYVLGNFVCEVDGSPSGSKLFFPVGDDNYRPILVEGVDQSSTTSFSGSFENADPSLLSSIFNLLNVLTGLIPENIWSVTPSITSNVTDVDKITLTYGPEDGVSDPDELRIAQLRNISTIEYWINVGGVVDGVISADGGPNGLDSDLGSFTLGNLAGTNFTTLLSIFVDPAGDDSNSGGSLISPKQTLNSAYALAQLTGSTINIADGSYDESLEISKDITLTGTGSPSATEIIINANISFTNFSADNVTVREGSSIQSGIDLVTDGGTVTVDPGTFSEHLSLDHSFTLNGANVGIAASETRNPETIILAVSAVNPLGLDIVSSDITVDGLQLGEDDPGNELRVPIYSYDNNNLTIQNNRVYAMSAGMIIQNVTSGDITISDNSVTLNSLEDLTDDQLVIDDATIGIGLGAITGTTIANLNDNDVDGGSYGMLFFAVNNSSDPLTIDGGNITNCTKGIQVTNVNPENTSQFSPSQMAVQNVTMSDFVDPAAGVSQPDTQAGVYVSVTGLASATDDIIVSMDNLDISDVGNSSSDMSAIYIADFQAAGPYDGSDDDGIGITASINNSYLHDNLNRAIYVRGNNAHLDAVAMNFENNGFDPFGSGNDGYNMVVRNYASATISNSYLTNPASQTNHAFAGLGIQDSNCELIVSSSNLNQNGNGTLAIGSGINLSENYFNSTDENEINTWVNGNDFNPYLENDTDVSPGVEGFQPDLSAMHVTTLGDQIEAVSRKQEGHNRISANGTLYVNDGDYTGSTIAISKDLTAVLTGTPEITNLSISNNSTLNLQGNLLTHGAISLTNAFINVEDGELLLSPTASDISESSTGYITGSVSMQARTIGTDPINFLGVDISAGVDDMGNITITRISGDDAIYTNAEGYQSIAVRWDITADNQPISADRGLSFTWISEFDNSLDMTQATIVRFNGLGWDVIDGPFDISASTPRTIGTTGISEFSEWSVAMDSEPLPVVLSHFEAEKKNNHVLLTWQTESEINSDYFSIEKSKNGIEFEEIDQVSSHHNSSSTNNYSCQDFQISNVTNYYRLKMIDFDGSFEYSKTVSVGIDPDSNFTAAPNPTGGQLNIITNEEISSIKVYSVSGKLERTFFNTSQIDLGELLQGIYLLQIQTPESSRILRIKKM